MPDPSKVTLFVAAALVLLVTPGPSVFYIMARSIDQGRTAGIASVLGIGVGTLFHVVAAALGLSALLLASALAFNLVKFIGAAYLIYLGVRKLLVREELHQSETERRQPLRSIFYQGILVNLLNPKTALFIFAFLPQFVDPARGAVAGQILFLGLLLMALGALSDGAYAFLAGTMGQWLRGNLRFLRAQRYVTGTVYIALGVTAALSGSNRK